MSRIRIFALLTALICALGTATCISAAEVDAGSVYCFSGADFSGEEEPLSGICITALPDPNAGTVMLGARVLRPGDILTASQVEEMTFLPLDTREDAVAAMSYLPIYASRVAPETTMTLAIRGREDKAPVAEDSAMETYKNLENTAPLKVNDPENQPMTFTVTRQPRRGTVEIHEDGTFTYTPKKNKTGVDSFTFTATDPAGNVSREATVTVTILKPTDAAQYTDTLGTDCRFTAEWMKNTGIFTGEQVGNARCFQPEMGVTRGEFVTMLVKALEIPVEEDAAYTGYTNEIPGWLQPYLAAAARAGLTCGLPEQETFDFGSVITGGEAAVMIQNALDLSWDSETVMAGEEELPQWAQGALKALYSHGILLGCTEPMSRADAANTLYLVHKAQDDAPGMRIIRSQA